MGGPVARARGPMVWTRTGGGSAWPGARGRGGRPAELEPDAIRVLDVEEAGLPVGDLRLQPSSSPLRPGDPPCEVRDVDAEMVELRSRAERLVERGPGRVIVQLQAMVGPRELQMHPFSPVVHHPSPEDAEPQGPVESERPRKVPDPDPGVEEAGVADHGRPMVVRVKKVRSRAPVKPSAGPNGQPW